MHAITEWGPTWIQARASKTANGSLAGALGKKPVDLAPFQNSVRQRWAEVLGGDAANAIKAGFEAEAAEAEFGVTSSHLAGKFNGDTNSARDLERSITAHYAGQTAAAGLGLDDDEAKDEQGSDGA